VARIADSGRAVTIAERAGHDIMAAIYRAVTQEGPLAARWYLRERDAGDQRRPVASLAADGSPRPAFAWPLGIAECAGVRGFGYATRWVPERFVTLNRVVFAEEQPPLRTLACIGGELAAAFAALHASGLRFRAVDFGSVLADPEARRLARPLALRRCRESGAIGILTSDALGASQRLRRNLAASRMRPDRI